MKVTLNQVIDLGGYNGGFEYVTEEWPIWQAGLSQPKEVAPSKLVNTDTELIEKCIKKFGYTDLETFIRHKLGIKGRNGTATWYFSVPIYARISDVKINEEYLPVISVVHHKDLGPLKLSVTLKSRNYEAKDHYSYDVVTGEEDYSKTKLVLPTIQKESADSDAFQLNLLHPVLGEVVDRKYSHVKELLLQSGFVSSPLFRAASLFFRDDALLHTLKSPKKSKKKDAPQIAFETAVGNLLTLGGFETVLLAGHDIFKDDSNIEIGAADILAYEKTSGTLLVIDCKITLTAGDIIDKIASTANLVKEQIKEPLIDVIPVIVTSQCAADFCNRAQSLGVIVVDGQLIEQLYNQAKLRPLTLGDFKGDAAVEKYVL
jgi:hypothetical protein